MTQATGRDRYLDVLRAVAIVRVVTFHMFAIPWLSWLPAMGVMFALGGSLMAASMQRSAVRAVGGRIRRLLPALWVMGLIVVPAMFRHGWTAGDDGRDRATLVFWLVPLAQPPGNAWAADVTVVLWYLATYLWLVVLSPVAWWMFRRRPLLTVLLPLALLPLVEHGLSYGGWQLDFFALNNRAATVMLHVATFGACWCTGFAHRTGALHRMRLPVLLSAAAVCIAAGAARALIPNGVAGAADLDDIPAGEALYSLGFVVLLLRAAPAMSWLRRARPLDALVTLINARAVTVYLWHNAAIAVCFPIGDRLHAWRAGQFGYFAVALALLAAVAVVLGWVEDLAAKRRPVLFPTGHTRTSQPPHIATPPPQSQQATTGGNS
ncbi:acyltransferase family protein [Dactylosporangium sp. CA-092794]|uniref:acyltransferase family protein n=1 Tax=Dactylosporangium sp. CA-092794 TaxID=3239929 RepID=UPI003D90D71C